MSTPYDTTTKDLIEHYPADWLALGGWPAQDVTVIDADLATVAAEADKVIRVGGPTPWLLHLELQVSYKLEVPGRVEWYNTLLRYRHGLNVRSLVILLQPRADGPAMSGVYTAAFPGEEPYLTFRYQVVRPWQMPAATFLSGGLGTLPLAPLADVTEADLPGIVDRMRERATREAPAEAATLLASSFLLIGMRYDDDLLIRLAQRVPEMEDNAFYRVVLGRGEVAEARRLVLRLGNARFGAPDEQTVAAISAIPDRDRLELLADRLLVVSNWQELLTEN